MTHNANGRDVQPRREIEHVENLTVGLAVAKGSVIKPFKGKGPTGQQIRGSTQRHINIGAEPLSTSI